MNFSEFPILNVNISGDYSLEELNEHAEYLEDEIEKMRKDAQAHSAEDKRKREEIDIKNQADAVVYQTESQVKEMADKLSDEDKGKIDAALGRLKEAQKGDNLDEIKSSLEILRRSQNSKVSNGFTSLGITITS